MTPSNVDEKSCAFFFIVNQCLKAYYMCFGLGRGGDGAQLDGKGKGWEWAGLGWTVLGWAGPTKGEMRKGWMINGKLWFYRQVSKKMRQK